MCKCDCNNIKENSSNNLRKGESKSCGCLNSEDRQTHGDPHTPFYDCLRSMMKRCYKTNSQDYIHYGARGIIVYERWYSYEIFKEDVYNSYLDHQQQNNNDTTIERNNVNGNYEPSNCRWVTRHEQNTNHTTNKIFEAEYTIPGPSFGYKEQSNNQTDFARKYNLTYDVINRRLKKNSLEDHKGWIFRYI